MKLLSIRHILGAYHELRNLYMGLALSVQSHVKHANS